MEFIESAVFSRRRPKFMTDEELTDLMAYLAAHPEAGDAIPGGGGIRKVRWTNSQRGKGKRSGSRTIYLHISIVETVHLLLIYDHEVQDDLTAADRKELASWARDLRIAAEKELEKRRRQHQGGKP